MLVLDIVPNISILSFDNDTIILYWKGFDNSINDNNTIKPSEAELLPGSRRYSNR